MTHRVEREWAGETVVILAGGPSLQGFNAEVLRGRARVITINDSWRLKTDADVFYFCDSPWWVAQAQMERIALDGSQLKFSALRHSGRWFKGGQDSAFGDTRAATDPQVKVLQFTGEEGLETDPSALRHGKNSGYAAINLAYHFGTARIILLGYDMHVQGSRSHWHLEERTTVAQFEDAARNRWRPKFQHLVKPLAAAGVEVINATPGSALTCWPMMTLEEALSKGPKETNEWQRTPQKILVSAETLP